MATVAVVAWGGWMTGQHPHRLGWGVLMAIVGEGEKKHLCVCVRERETGD